VSERYRPQDGSFTDLDPYSFFFHPNQVITAAELAEGKTRSRIEAIADRYSVQNPRKVLWTEKDGTKHYLELIPFFMPTGASALTLGTLSFADDGIGTYTPTLQNDLVLWTGALVGNNARADLVAGMVFADLFTSVPDVDQEKWEVTRVTSLGPGDFCWLVRKGSVNLRADATITDNGALVTAASGEVSPAANVSTASVAAYENSIVEHTTGDGRPDGECVAIARAARTGAGQVLCELVLPSRYEAQ